MLHIGTGDSLVLGTLLPNAAKEAAVASEINPALDGYGIYLVAVDNRNPSSIGEVLAKFASPEAAERLAQFFRIHGHLVEGQDCFEEHYPMTIQGWR